MPENSFAWIKKFLENQKMKDTISPQVPISKTAVLKIMRENKKKKQMLKEDFNNEISRLADKIKYLDETRKPWSLYDNWIGTPQDKLKMRIEILETLRDSDFMDRDESLKSSTSEYLKTTPGSTSTFTLKQNCLHAES